MMTRPCTTRRFLSTGRAPYERTSSPSLSSRLMMQHGEDSGDDEDLDGDGIADSEIVEVGNALWKHHLLLY